MNSNLVIPKFQDIIIIGGGSSINESIMLGLKEKLENKFVITCNCACHHFKNTFTTFLDKKIWSGKLLGTNNKYINYKHLKIIRNQKLLIGCESARIKTKPDNLIILKKDNIDNKEHSLTKGFYTKNLTGIFSLSIASFLLNYIGNIYLLGFDWTMGITGKTDTHYYSKSEINHKGQHKTNYYNTHKPDIIFKPFLLHSTQIYNVSSVSNINVFKKITYSEMFEKIKNINLDQNNLRTYIKTRLINHP